MKLPKNIKQIGNPEEGDRIYIEDYVDTFLSRLDKNRDHSGLLVGNKIMLHGVPYYFIFGAVEEDNLWEPDGNCIFSEQSWLDAKKDAVKFFKDSVVCGWYIVRKRGEETSQSQIENQHKNAFFSEEGILFLKEDEDQYIFSGSKEGWRRRKGFFEYFEQNSDMQNYMLKFFAQKPFEDPEPETAMVNFRERVVKNKIKKKEINRHIYAAAGGLAAVVVVAAAINIFSAANKGQDVNPAEIAGATVVISDLTDADEISRSGFEESEASGESDIVSGSEDESVNASASGDNSTTVAEAEETALEAAAAVVYQVKKGDTLNSICIERYGDTSRLYEVCLLNNISNENFIVEGQQIVLP